MATTDNTTLSQEGNGAGCVIAIVLGTIALIFGMMVLSFISDGRWFVPGDISSFDPVQQYDAILNHAGDGVFLTEIRASFVKSDGTLELNANYEPQPTVTYSFYRLTGNASNAPVGVFDPSAVEYEEVTIFVGVPFGLPFINESMDRNVRDASIGTVPENLPPPTCHFSDLWAEAIASQGADPDAVAQIRYDQDGYDFRITGTDVRLEFNFNCQVID